jgi:nicotinamidase-related amidase
MDFMDDRLRRKLIKRRGRLHVFDQLIAAKTAVIVIDLTQPIYDAMPSGTALIEPVNRLTEAARPAGVVVAWIAPLPPSHSPSEAGIDTVILAGVLTDVCVASSARDAFESGHRVLVCSDGVAANEELLHAMTLRTLARGYADVRPSDELAELLARAA